MLLGVRRMMNTDGGPEVVYEYRLDSFGNIVQTAGKRRADKVYMGAWSNVLAPEIAKRHGMKWTPIPMGKDRILTQADGAEFLLALLVKYARTAGYGSVEPIEA